MRRRRNFRGGRRCWTDGTGGGGGGGSGGDDEALLVATPLRRLIIGGTFSARGRLRDIVKLISRRRCPSAGMADPSCKEMREGDALHVLNGAPVSPMTKNKRIDQDSSSASMWLRAGPRKRVPPPLVAPGHTAWRAERPAREGRNH